MKSTFHHVGRALAPRINVEEGDEEMKTPVEAAPDPPAQPVTFFEDIQTAL
jgi:hypothetical protein